jgi:uncharacterized membrane protein (DUF373 family)
MIGPVPSPTSGPARIGRYASIQEDERLRASRSNTPHTDVNRLTRRFIESFQDIVVFGLVIALFALMIRTLWSLVGDVFEAELDFRTVISEVLFMLVMVELVRLLLVYLHEHHIAVDFMVELGIVSTLREVVLHGVVDLDWHVIAALSVFLIALGFLLRYGDLRPRYAEEFDGSEVGDIERDTQLDATSAKEKPS